jgi:enterochelin esterase-like enzyme
VLGPQGTGFFLLLIVAFAGLLVWAMVTRHVVFRTLACCLAFIPAMAFGIAAVNKYYDYYQTWGAVVSDLNGGAANLPGTAAGGLNTSKEVQQYINRNPDAAEFAEVGETIDTKMPGPVAGAKRDVLIWLPPQYFQAHYAHYRFPVIELLHGSPGNPEQWIDALDVIDIYLGLLANHQAQPAVLVMPDTDGGLKYALQCLNNPGGIQDMNFVAKEVPEKVYHLVRVQPPGKAWGVAGYSEGGYCAANIALNVPGGYGYAGVISGYFAPIPSQVPKNNQPDGAPITMNVFEHDPAAALRNTPDEYVTHIPPGIEVPLFWMAAGIDDKGDVEAMEQFQVLAGIHQSNITALVIPGGGHTGGVWRAALTPMLQWMTPQLAQQAALAHSKTPPAKTAPGKTAPAKTAPGKRAPAKTAPGHPRPGASRTPPAKRLLGEETAGKERPVVDVPDDLFLAGVVLHHVLSGLVRRGGRLALDGRVAIAVVRVAA